MPSAGSCGERSSVPIGQHAFMGRFHVHEIVDDAREACVSVSLGAEKAGRLIFPHFFFILALAESGRC